MHAHAADFRSEVRGDDAAAKAEALLHDWRTAPLSAADRALCAYGEKLALRPGEMEESDVAALRAAGFDDRAIHDAAQAVAYFSYINRIADGLGVDLEPGMPPDPRAVPVAPVEDGLLRAAGEAMGSILETGTMTIVWRCMKCNHHFPAGEALPDKCESCGAPRTEFALVEED